MKNMKNIITLLLVNLLFFYSSAQTVFDRKNVPTISFSAGLDFRQITVGSNATNGESEFDIIVGCQWLGGNSVESDITFERFNRIGFSRFGTGIGYKIPVTDRINVTPAVEFSMILRGPVEKEYVGHGNFLTMGVSTKIGYELTERLDIQGRFLLINRNDLYLEGTKELKLLPNFYVELVYKIIL